MLMVLQAMADEFPVSRETVKACLRDFRLAGRFQVIPGEIPCILDVAHNRQAISALVENVKKIPCVGETHVVIGMLKDKNHAAVFETLAQIADHWYVAELQADRAASPAELAGVLGQFENSGNVRQFQTVREALVEAEARTLVGDRIIVTGSFVTVGSAIDYLK